jgi:superfamily II DNA or RNA helicase
MIYIKKGVTDSEIIGVSPLLRQQLKAALSFEDKSKVIAQAVARKKYGYIPKWMKTAGVVCLIDDNNRVPTGLLDRCIAILEAAGEEYQYLEQPQIPEATPVKLHKALNLWNHQNDAMAAIKDKITGMVRIGTGGGKALSLDTKVLTPYGYKLMRDLTLKDEVITPEGKSKIIGIYPQGFQDVYEITFSDETVAESTLDHLWAVRSAKDKYNKKDFKILSLEEIKNIGLNRTNCKKSSRHFIPITNPIENFDTQNLNIHPYLLGVLIGDGSLHSSSICFTTIDEEIVQNINQVIPSNMKVKQYKGSISYGISNNNPNGNKKNLIMEYLKSVKLNVLSIYKFIPEEYKLASKEQRISLLQGLLDTDGGVEDGRRISFSTSSYLLAQDVQFLVQSLGGITKIKTRKTKCNDSYRLIISLPNEIQPFKLTRKLNLLKKRTKYFPTRAIKAINYKGKKEVQCIKIEDEKGLFLIDNCVVTHNTKLSVKTAAEVGQFPYLFVVNRISLLTQTHNEYSNYFKETIGWIGDGKIDVQRINIATIGTICSILKIKTDTEKDENLNYTPEQIFALRKLLKECKFVVVDECHHAASDTYKRMMKALPNAIYRIGLSATPFRTDGQDLLLEAAFGSVIYSKSASELIREGVLCQPEIFFVKYKDSELTKKYPKNARGGSYNTIYKECVVQNEHFNTIVARLAIINAALNRLTLVSVKQVKHGKLIYDILKSLEPELPIEFLHGKNKDVLGEEKIKEDFATGKIKILISTLFDEGVDIPSVVAIVDAGGGKSPIKALQLIGRAIRKFGDKNKAYVFMFIQPYQHLYKHSNARAQILQTEEAFNLQVLDWEDE